MIRNDMPVIVSFQRHPMQALFFASRILGIMTQVAKILTQFSSCPISYSVVWPSFSRRIGKLQTLDWRFTISCMQLALLRNLTWCNMPPLKPSRPGIVQQRECVAAELSGSIWLDQKGYNLTS
jgi:hypothetical protein